MGTYLFNVHVLSKDRERVGLALAGYPTGLPALISDSKGRWVSVYPDRADVRKLSRYLSEELDNLVVGFEVYDSDGCRCSIYKGGVLVALHAIGIEGSRTKPGDPDRFARYALPSTRPRLVRTLHRRPVLAEEVVYELSELLGISRPRAELSYHFIGTGEPLPETIVRLEGLASDDQTDRGQRHASPQKRRPSTKGLVGVQMRPAGGFEPAALDLPRGLKHFLARVSVHSSWGDDAFRRQSVGDFLGRLTSLFGSSPHDSWGFAYPLRHAASGCVVVATINEGTPGYAAVQAGGTFTRVARNLDNLLESAPLSDCEVVHQSWSERGDPVLVRSGVAGGKAFDFRV